MHEENSHLADALRYLSGGLQRMTYTANIELCQELYELSGWKGIDNVSYRLVEGKPVATNAFDDRVIDETALYDLGYLVRKFVGNGGIELRYGDKVCEATSHMWTAHAQTPEDAVALLAIHHFNTGVFKRE
jgi:hypothetical protein